MIKFQWVEPIPFVSLSEPQEDVEYEIEFTSIKLRFIVRSVALRGVWTWQISKK